MIKVTTQLFIYRDDDKKEEEEIELTIVGNVSHEKEYRGGGNPDNWHPATGEVEIISILLDKEKWDGKLTENEVGEAEAALQAQFEDDMEAAEDDEADRKYEEARDDAADDYEYDLRDDLYGY